MDRLLRPAALVLTAERFEAVRGRLGRFVSVRDRLVALRCFPDERLRFLLLVDEWEVGFLACAVIFCRGSIMPPRENQDAVTRVGRSDLLVLGLNILCMVDLFPCYQ